MYNTKYFDVVYGTQTMCMYDDTYLHVHRYNLVICMSEMTWYDLAYSHKNYLEWRGPDYYDPITHIYVTSAGHFEGSDNSWLPVRPLQCEVTSIVNTSQPATVVCTENREHLHPS